MTRSRIAVGFICLALVSSPCFVFAETVDLVTYYPATFSGGDLSSDRFHADQATVGDPYSLTNPAALNNGTLLVAGPVGIGTGFGAAAPLGPLHVVGTDNQTSSVLLMPGAGTGQIRLGIGPGFTQANPPAGPLHVVGVNDATSSVILMPGADTVAAGVPEIRLGIGPGFTQANPPAGPLHVVTSGTTINDFQMDTYNDTFTADPALILRRARGTLAVPQAVIAADRLGSLIFQGYAAGNFVMGAQLQAYAAGAPAGANVPTSLGFLTNNGTLLTQRMTLTSAGNLGLGTAAPNANALLELTSTTQGLLPPRMTTVQRDAITGPAGLMIFNSSTNQPNYHDGTRWVAPDYAVYVDEQPNGTAAPFFNAGVWVTRTLTTTRGSSGSSISRSGNRITLTAGTYYVEGSAPAYYVGRHKARFRNITNNVTALVGTSEYSYTTTSRSVLRGIIIVPATKVFEIQHRCKQEDGIAGNPNCSLGVPGANPLAPPMIDEVEVYAEVSIFRIG